MEFLHLFHNDHGEMTMIMTVLAGEMPIVQRCVLCWQLIRSGLKHSHKEHSHE